MIDKQVVIVKTGLMASLAEKLALELDIQVMVGRHLVMVPGKGWAVHNYEIVFCGKGEPAGRSVNLRFKSAYHIKSTLAAMCDMMDFGLIAKIRPYGEP